MRKWRITLLIEDVFHDYEYETVSDPNPGDWNMIARAAGDAVRVLDIPSDAIRVISVWHLDV